MSPHRASFLFGGLLVLTGLGFYSYAYTQDGEASPTALIPAVLGGLILALAWVAGRNPALNKHLMHGVAVVALLGLLGSLRVIPRISPFILSGGTEGALAVPAQVLTILWCALLLLVLVRSFIAARRARA